MLMLDSCHWRRSVEFLRKENDAKLAAKPHRMWYAFGVDDKAICAAQEMKLNKTAHIFTVILRCEATFTDTVWRLLTYAGALEEDYGVCVFDVRLSDKVEDMITPNSWLPTLERRRDATLEMER